MRETAALEAVQARARLSGGSSAGAIHRLVARTLADSGCGGTLVDVGCGSGSLWPYVRGRFRRYVGVDAVAYDGFPEEGELVLADLNAGLTGVPSGLADAVVAVETIEHLENPRAFVRELVRIVRPGGWVVVTTPNQLSLLSLATLAVRGRFAAFQDVHYPAHLTALLDVDLLRMAAECRLEAVRIDYTAQGRMVFTSRHYPAWMARRFPRLLSDNVLLAGRRPPCHHSSAS